MKRSHNEIDSTSSSSPEEERKKVKVNLYQVIITLDQTIGSKLLYHKFRIQTTELQLFLQQAPVLYWQPLQLIGTINFKYNIDDCVFRAAVRNPLHEFSSIDSISRLLNPLDISNKAWEAPKPNPQRIHCLQKDYDSLDKSKLSSLLKSLLDDELFILEATSSCKNVHEFISDRLKDNEEFILKLTKQQQQHAHSFISNIPQPVSSQVKVSECKSDLVCDELTRKYLDVVKKNGLALRSVPDRFKDDELIVFEAIKQNGGALRFASNRLKDNEQIVLEAIKQNSSALESASNRLQDNEEIVLQAVKQNGYAFRFASNRLQYNEEIVLEAVKKHGGALTYVPNRFQDNEQIVLEAVKQNGISLEWASNRLKDNDQIVLEAVKQNYSALDYASDRLKDNEEFILEAVKQNGRTLKFASKRLRNDFNFANQIFKSFNTLEVFAGFGEELRSIELIYYFIENYQSHFHELIRNYHYITDYQRKRDFIKYLGKF